MSYSIGFDIFANDKASGTFDKLGGKVGETGGKFSKFAGVAKLAVAGAGVAIVKFASDSVAAYTDAEAQQRKLTDAYGRFPALADVSIQSLRDLATAQQNKTKFDGDEVAAAMGSLAQYKLTGTQLQQLTPLMLDYAEKTGKSLPDAALAMGKAVQGSGKALKDVGIKFTDLKDPTKNFDQLMGGLRTQVGGFAEKEGKSAEGRAAILKNKFGDIQETVGSKLQPVLIGLTDQLIKIVDWMGKNETTVKVLGTAIGVLVVGIGGLVAITRIYTAVHAALSVVWAMSPIGLIVVAVGLLVAGIVLLATKTTFFQTAWKAMTDALGVAWQWLWNTILAPIIRFVLNGFASITDGIASMLRVLSNIPGFEWAKTAADKMDGAADKARALAQGIKDIPDRKNVTITIAEVYTGGRSAGKGLGGSGGMVAGRATGGPLRRGETYLVGEEGPELHTATSDGYITNARDTARLLAGGGSGRAVAGGGGGGDVVTHTTVNLDGRVLFEAMRRQAIEEARRNGASGITL